MVVRVVGVGGRERVDGEREEEGERREVEGDGRKEVVGKSKERQARGGGSFIFLSLSLSFPPSLRRHRGSNAHLGFRSLLLRRMGHVREERERRKHRRREGEKMCFSI